MGRSDHGCASSRPLLVPDDAQPGTYTPSPETAQTAATCILTSPPTIARSSFCAVSAGTAPFTMSTTTMEPSPGIVYSHRTGTSQASGYNIGKISDETLDLLSPDQKCAPNSLPSANRLRPKGSFTSYHKPIRSEWPRSSASMSDPQRELAARSTTPSDAGPDVSIGMALGSPSHPPDYTMASWSQFMPTVTTTVESWGSNRDDDPPKSKSRKWGLFSRTRSKRGKLPDARLKEDDKGSPSASSVHRPRKQLDNGAQDERDSFYSRPRPLAKSRTDPIMGERSRSPQTLLARRGTSSPLAKDVGEKTGQRQKGERDFRSPSPESPSFDQLLDISIPDVTMERYSVMFSHLIEDRSTTSLLARRQATRDKLKAIQEGQTLTQLSASSGSSPRAPILRKNGPLLQLALPDRDPGPLLSPLQRSNTFPAALSSPSQANSKAGEESRDQLDAPLHVAASTRPNAGKIQVAAATSLPAERPRLISKFHQRSSSDQGVASAPTPLATSRHLRARDKPPGSEAKISPQTWNTAHPPHSAPVAATPLPTAGDVVPLDQEPDKAPVQDPVQVSIERQISVSRQQQALLGPLQKQMSRRRRVNETKSSTPHFIDPWQDPKLSPALHRMSERAVVEGA